MRMVGFTPALTGAHTHRPKAQLQTRFSGSGNWGTVDDARYNLFNGFSERSLFEKEPYIAGYGIDQITAKRLDNMPFEYHHLLRGARVLRHNLQQEAGRNFSSLRTILRVVNLENLQEAVNDAVPPEKIHREIIDTALSPLWRHFAPGAMLALYFIASNDQVSSLAGVQIPDDIRQPLKTLIGIACENVPQYHYYGPFNTSRHKDCTPPDDHPEIRDLLHSAYADQAISNLITNLAVAQKADELGYK